MGGRAVHRLGAGPLRRRAVLTAAAGWALTGLAGCRWRPGRGPAPTERGTTPPAVVGIGWPTPPAGIAKAVAVRFSADNPGFGLQYPSDPGPKVAWWLEEDFQGLATVDLGPALRVLNFDPNVLPPAIWTAVDAGATLRHLPSTLFVYAVRYSVAALARAGAAVPAPDWTWDDLRLTCAQVDAALRLGSLEDLGITSVLPYMAGDPRYHDFLGSLYDVPLWSAFIQGFGGEVVADGRAAVATPAAADGLQALVELVWQYGNDPAAALDGSSKAVALSFWQLPVQAPAQGQDTGIAYARFPRLPARAVVPAQLGVRGLHDGPAPLARVPPNVIPPAAVVECAARFFMWRYQAAQQQLFADAGVIPLGNAGGLQEAFFRDTYEMTIDPADIVITPPIPGGLPWSWMDGLEAAVTAPEKVPAVLASLSQLIDAALAGQGEN